LRVRLVLFLDPPLCPLRFFDVRFFDARFFEVRFFERFLRRPPVMSLRAT